MTFVTYQFSTASAIDSALIRWGTWSEYSHVDIVMPDGNLLGARLHQGVQVRPPNYAKFSKSLRMSVAMNDREAQRFYEAARSQVGKPYDWKAILGFAVRRDWQDEGQWFCSELALWCAMQAGLRMLNLDRIDRCSPETLLLSPLLIPERSA